MLRVTFTDHRFARPYLPTCLAVLAVLAGCESESSAPRKPTTTSRQQLPPAAGRPAPEPVNELQVTVDASGRKWLTPEVPYDVFPDLPSDEEVAAGGRGSAADMTIASAARSDVAPAIDRPVPTADPPDRPDTPTIRSDTPSSSAGIEWDAILPQESLQSEIAIVRNSLNEKLLTVGSYNAAFEEIANDGWLMSALATVVHEHPASLSWKNNALLARDAAVGIAMAATARGRENFNDAVLAKEQLVATLNNNPPAGLPAPDPEASREETADRSALMRRMQAAADRLKSAAADASALNSNAVEAGHEARLLATLAKFTSHSDYGSTENDDYQTLAAEIVAAGGAMAQAAAADDHAGFRAAFDRVGTACNQCHNKFRFEN